MWVILPALQSSTSLQVSPSIPSDSQNWKASFWTAFCWLCSKKEQRLERQYLLEHTFFVHSHLCKANTILPKVKFRVVRSNEHISKNPERPHRRRNVHAHETGQADGPAHLTNLHDVVLWSERKVNSSNCESNCWKWRNCRTIWD